MNFNKNIVLGSGSPRRKLLLKELGFNFRILTSKADEVPLPHLKREKIAEYLAEEKANSLSGQIKENEILITADTIVCLGSVMLGKPSDSLNAIEMLSLLNGRRHQVYTGICLFKNNEKKIFSVESNVVFRKLNENEIQKYIEVYKPFDKAGSYGAQESLPEGINSCSEKEIKFMKKFGFEKLFERTLPEENINRIPLIDHIEGSYFNVMGLPVVELFEELMVFS